MESTRGAPPPNPGPRGRARRSPGQPRAEGGSSAGAVAVSESRVQPAGGPRRGAPSWVGPRAVGGWMAPGQRPPGAPTTPRAREPSRPGGWGGRPGAATPRGLSRGGTLQPPPDAILRHWSRKGNEAEQNHRPDGADLKARESSPGALASSAVLEGIGGFDFTDARLEPRASDSPAGVLFPTALSRVKTVRENLNRGEHAASDGV